MDSRGTPPEMSNFYCLPGRAGGTPILLASLRPVRIAGRGSPLRSPRPTLISRSRLGQRCILGRFAVAGVVAEITKRNNFRAFGIVFG